MKTILNTIGLFALFFATVAVAKDHEITNAELAVILSQSDIAKLKNQAFTAYNAMDNGAQTAIPFKLALVGGDELSVNFLKNHQSLLENEHYQIALIGDEDLLADFNEAYPKLENVTVYALDESLHMMAYALGINYYPALYDNGDVSP